MSTWTRHTDGLQRDDLERRVSELEKLVAQLVKVIKITGGGVSIESQGNISINCPICLSIGATSVSIKSGSNLGIEAAIVQIQGQAYVDIKGAPVRLNGGSKPVARTGDMAVPTSSAPGAPSVIGLACPTVLA